MSLILLMVIVFTFGELAGAQVGVRTPFQPIEPPLVTAATIQVVKGDHLWGISADHIGSNAPGSEIGPYWLRVVAENTPHLRSGDPDLIYPGEVIALPALDLSGQP